MTTQDAREAVRSHWLLFDDERNIAGCHCGFKADVEADCGYGDSVVAHLLADAKAEALRETADDWQFHLRRDAALYDYGRWLNAAAKMLRDRAALGGRDA